MYLEDYKGYNLKGSEETLQPRRDVLSYRVFVSVKGITEALLVVTGEVAHQNYRSIKNEVKDLSAKVIDILKNMCITKAKEQIDKQDFVTFEINLQQTSVLQTLKQELGLR